MDERVQEEKVKFIKVFANLPESIRNADIIVVVDKKPYTWNIAYFEIKNDTPIGKKILEKLKETKVI